MSPYAERIFKGVVAVLSKSLGNLQNQLYATKECLACLMTFANTLQSEFSKYYTGTSIMQDLVKILNSVKPDTPANVELL